MKKLIDFISKEIECEKIYNFAEHKDINLSVREDY